jgi:DNA repair protein RecN (Recombination protein N)
VDALDAALRDVDDLSEIDERFRPLSQQLEEARTALEEVARELQSLSEQVEFDPRELEELNQRITVLGSLKRKYGDSIEAVLAYRDEAVAEIERFESREQDLVEMQRQRAHLLEESMAAAHALSRKRKAAARKLTRKVTEALQELGMRGGAFHVHFDAIELTPHGVDRVEFLLAANPGEKPKALRVVASGGEVSRVMLALKAVFAAADTIPILIFDEIDAGVGGGVATKVAARLRQLAASHQVLCISHIAQIAATAQAHYHVSKATKQNRTFTTLRSVEGQARVEEIARLLDGSLSEVSINHARALLDMS